MPCYKNRFDSYAWSKVAAFSPMLGAVYKIYFFEKKDLQKSVAELLCDDHALSAQMVYARCCHCCGLKMYSGFFIFDRSVDLVSSIHEVLHIASDREKRLVNSVNYYSEIDYLQHKYMYIIQLAFSRTCFRHQVPDACG